MALINRTKWAQVKGAFSWCKISNCDVIQYEKISKYLDEYTSGWCYLEGHSRSFLIAFELEGDMVMFKIWCSGVDQEAQHEQ